MRIALTERLKALENKYPWSMVGVIITLLIAVGTLYFTDKRPELYVDIETNTAVVDIKGQVPNLRILYEGVDVRKNGLSLRILKLKIKNDSDIDILRTYYDPKDPVSIAIDSGKIVGADLIDASSSYLKESLSLTRYGEKAVLLNDVIFDAHSFILIKLLILHPDDLLPVVSTGGHVAGIDVIPVRDTSNVKDRRSTWQKTLDFGVALLRAFGVLLLLMVALIVAGVVISAPFAFIDSLKKKSVIKHYRDFVDFKLGNEDEVFLVEYKQGGSDQICRIQTLLGDEGFLNDACSEYSKRVANFEAEDERSQPPGLLEVGEDKREVYVTTLRNLMKNELIVKADGRWVVSPRAQDALGKFVGYLKSQGEISEVE